MATLPPDPPAGPHRLVDRAKRLLTTPRLEWPAIEAEPMRVSGIFRNWVVPLAAIPPVAMLIGSLLFGYGNALISIRPSFGFVLFAALFQFVGSLIATWGLAKIIELLAPSFGARPDPVQATKLAAFSTTAGWIGGIVNLFPPLAPVTILFGLYSLYLLWLGLPVLMRPVADKAVAYFAAVVIAAIVLFALCFTIAGRLAATFAGPPIAAVGVAGVGTIDTAGLDAANRRLDAAAASIEQASRDGQAGLVAGDQLQALIPASVAGFTRTEIENASGGVGGIGGNSAKGVFTSGNDRFTLSVADIGAMGAIASLGGALKVNTDRRTDTGYDKVVSTADGMSSEHWDGPARTGKISRMVAHRFVIEAEGQVNDIGILKTAADAVDTAKLAALPRN